MEHQVNQSPPLLQPQPPQANDQQARPDAKALNHRSKNRLWLLVAGLIIVLAALGAYWLGRHQAPRKVSSKTTTSLVKAQPNPPPSSSAATTTDHYVSNGSSLNLEFDYPSNWSVTPATNDNTQDQPITVTSPLISITDSSGTTITGKIVVSIRPSSQSISELSSNSPIIAQDSIQFAYKQPTSAQYQYPFLSFIHFTNGSPIAGSFEEVMITGTQSFKKGDAITAATADPVISASFYKCSTSACLAQSATPLSISNATWQNAAPLVAVQDLFASLKLN
ncbi:MAG TPA: hypothetical protein VNE40_03180 [Candidatus Dormibacteraeota bacterium]|nr:hypothetical protein [Candidatus Dormibacteraeota bacterium]